MARDGFNICLVSRTKSKLEAAVSELAPYKVETRVIVADFSGASNLLFYEDTILRYAKDLDIGLLVLSAGVSGNAPFLSQEASTLQTMVDINCYHVGALMIKMQE